MTAWERLEILPNLSRSWSEWLHWWAHVRIHYGAAWWNRWPLIWISLACIAEVFGWLAFLLLAPFGHWMRAHRLLAVVGLATYHLVTALGVFVLLMLVLPSRAVA